MVLVRRMPRAYDSQLTASYEKPVFIPVDKKSQYDIIRIGV